MRYSVIEPFSIKTVSGEVNLHAGRILELTSEQAAMLGGKVRPADDAPPFPADTPADWRPEFKAWLEGDELRTTGVCDDLATEIIKLTGDNIPLQKKLLRLHIGSFSGVHWLPTIRQWRERAAELFEQHGMGLHEANWTAAEEMHLMAFSDELKLKKPDTGEGE